MEVNFDINPVTYAVNNSIEIIDLFSNEEIKYDDVDEYEIILNSLNNIHKKYEEYIKVEEDIESRLKADIYNSFYINFMELKEQLEKNANKKLIINLSTNEEKNKLLINLYKKMFVIFDNIEVTIDKAFNKTRVIIKQNGKILK